MVDSNAIGIDGSAARLELDATCLAELKALDPHGEARLVVRVLTTYQASLAKLAAQMRHARADGSRDDVARAAHTLKSPSASIGALALSSLCAQIERLLRAGDDAATLPLLERFQAEVDRVDAAVTRTLERTATPEPSR